MASVFIIGKLINILVAVFREVGIKVTVTSGLRGTLKQVELYENRSTNPYPVALPGNSQHEFGVAADMVVDPSEALGILVDVWRELGFYWDSGDPVHFAVFSPAQWQELLHQIGIKLPAEEPPVYKLQKPQSQIGFNLTSLGYPSESPFVLPYQTLGYDVPQKFFNYQQAGTDWQLAALNPKVDVLPKNAPLFWSEPESSVSIQQPVVLQTPSPQSAASPTPQQSAEPSAQFVGQTVQPQQMVDAEAYKNAILSHILGR
jgi:hypothetical protein